MTRKRFITIAGFVLSILLLYLSLKDVKFYEIIDTVKKGDFRFVWIPVIFIMLAAILSAIKWAKILGGDVKFSETFVALFIGLFINNVLPARIGEVARGYAISKKKGISFTYALSTVLVDRFFDLIGLLLLTYIFLPKSTLPPKVYQALYLLIGFLILCSAMMIFMSRKKVAKIIAYRFAKTKKPRLFKIARRIMEVQENLARIHSPVNIASYIIIAFFQWLCMSIGLYFAVLTLNISIPFMYIPFVCALLNMGVAVPSSPGYVGIYQFLLVYLLSIFDVPKHEGFTVSILYHASWYFPYNILGFIFLMKEHLKIREIQSLEEKS